LHTTKYKCGSLIKISKALLISQNTVAKVIQTFNKDGSATISQRRPDHPWKLTSQQERLLVRWVEENPHLSSLQLKQKKVEKPLFCDTIRRSLQRNGMHGYLPRKKPLLKPMHRKDEDYWDSRLWSDETKITFWN
uniref:Transposase Tc1-like domain-containing protein n=1 Tax=Nothobranchius furzeri TaxID=105023 RepID=A0A8C6PLP7_NOTFU